MNSKQFKVKCKLIGYSILMIIFMIACMSCGSKETIDRNQKLEKERQVIEANIKTASKRLSNIAQRKTMLLEDVKVMEYVKQGNQPTYQLTLNIKHVTKRHHDCLLTINVSKEQYLLTYPNKHFELSGCNPKAFEVIVIAKEIKY